MSEKNTSNGYEIKNSTPELTAGELRDNLSEKFGIDGRDPRERMEQFKQLSPEGVAIMLEDIN